MEREPFPRTFFPATLLVVVIGYCAFIFWLSSIPSFPVAPPFAYFDKIVHICLFGGLGGVVGLGLHRAGHDYSRVARTIGPTLFCLAYGLSDEIHQSFVAGRTFDLTDLAADVVGAAMAAWLVLASCRTKEPSEQE